MHVVYERCAAIDVGKDEIAVAVRMPGDGPEGRVTVKRTFRTFYGVMGEAARWLVSLGVTHVAMEATGVYSMPVYYALVEHGDFAKVLICNAAHVKNVPGRKTDYADAEWLAHLLECGLLAGSFIPPAEIKDARDVVRYRAKVVRQRVSEIARIADLSMALEGRFGDHHALMCRLHLDHIDHLEAAIARLDARIEQMMEPFQCWRDLLATIPGIGQHAAAAVISEIGVAVAEFFPDDAHLASWTGLCPGNHQSAGKRRSGKPRPGNTHLQTLLVECAWAAVRHDGYLKSLFHRHVMKNGGYRSSTAKKKAIVVVAHAMIVIIWHVMVTGKPYHELGAGYFASLQDPERETRRLIARLQALGHTVTLDPAA